MQVHSFSSKILSTELQRASMGKDAKICALNSLFCLWQVLKLLLRQSDAQVFERKARLIGEIHNKVVEFGKGFEVFQREEVFRRILGVGKYLQSSLFGNVKRIESVLFQELEVFVESRVVRHPQLVSIGNAFHEDHIGTKDHRDQQACPNECRWIAATGEKGLFFGQESSFFLLTLQPTFHSWKTGRKIGPKPCCVEPWFSSVIWTSWKLTETAPFFLSRVWLHSIRLSWQRPFSFVCCNIRPHPYVQSPWWCALQRGKACITTFAWLPSVVYKVTWHDM